MTARCKGLMKLTSNSGKYRNWSIDCAHFSIPQAGRQSKRTQHEVKRYQRNQHSTYHSWCRRRARQIPPESRTETTSGYHFHVGHTCKSTPAAVAEHVSVVEPSIAKKSTHCRREIAGAVAAIHKNVHHRTCTCEISTVFCAVLHCALIMN